MSYVLNCKCDYYLQLHLGSLFKIDNHGKQPADLPSSTSINIMTNFNPQRPLPKGIYTPLPTFFTESEDLDLDSFGKHIQFVAEAGTIPVVAGSAGEAPHLSASERIELIQTARSALSSAGLDHVPVVAGVGAPSTRETIQLARDAKEAGADYVMVIPPGYYGGVLAKDRVALKKFFVDISNASPLPVIIYNFPAVSGGIDLDSDLIVSIAKEAPNAVGVKLTYVDCDLLP